jgi:hypothetical protein
MPRDQSHRKKFPRLRSIMIFGVVAALLVLLMLTALVVTAPRILSSAWMKSRITETAEQALRRPVRLAGLGFTWTDGLRVAGLRVAEDPAFSESDFLVLDHAHVATSIPDFFPPRVSVAVDLEGLHGQFIRDDEGRTNLEALLAQLKGKDGGPEAPIEPGTPPRVPVELTANIRIHDINFTAEDHRSGRKISLSEGRFDLVIPNLRSESVTLILASELTVDGRRLPPLGFSLTAGNFIFEDGTPNPMGATAEMTADLPGTHLDGRINLQTWENTLDLTCDVAALTDAAKPLLPEAAPEAAEGTIELSLNTSGNPTAEVSFETTLAATDLKISGGPLGAESAGPLHFRVVQGGTYLPREEQLIIRKGELSLLDATRLSWSGEIQDLLKPEKRVDLAMQDIHLDVGELVGAARPFLPDGMSVDFTDPASPPSLTVDSVALTGAVPSGSQEVRVNGLVLDMRGLNAAAGALRLKDTGFNFAMPRFSASMDRLFPVGVEVDTGLHLKRLMVEGPVRAEMSGVSVPFMRLTAGGMSGPKPMPEQVKLEASLGIEDLRLPDTGLAVTKLDVPEFTLTLAHLREVVMSAKAELARFQMGGPAPVSLENLALSDLSIRLNHPDLPTLLQAPEETDGAEIAPDLKADGTGSSTPSGTFAINAALAFDALELGGGTPVALKQFAAERFQVTGERIPLPELVPEKVGMVAEMSFDRLDVGGAQPAVLQGLQLDQVRMQMDEVALSPESRFGVSGRITLDQSDRKSVV